MPGRHHQVDLVDAELAPVLEVGIGDLLVAEHVPGRRRL